MYFFCNRCVPIDPACEKLLPSEFFRLLNTLLQRCQLEIAITIWKKEQFEKDKGQQILRRRKSELPANRLRCKHCGLENLKALAVPDRLGKLAQSSAVSQEYFS